MGLRFFEKYCSLRETYTLKSVSQMVDLVMTINSVQKSSKSELSSTTFGHSKVCIYSLPLNIYQKDSPPLNSPAARTWCKSAQIVSVGSAKACQRSRQSKSLSRNVKNLFFGSNFQSFPKSVRMPPNASRRIRTHPNASERIRTHPNASECIRTHPNASACI